MMAVSADRTSSTFFGSLPFNLTTWRFASLARHIKIRFRKARTLTLETDTVGACGQEMKNCIWQEVKNLTYCIDDILIWIRFTSQINFFQYHAFTGISFSEYFMTDNAIFLWSRWSKIQGKAYCIDKRRYPNKF